MSWQPKTTETAIANLMKELEEVRNNSINFSSPVNQNASIPGISGLGQASGGLGAIAGSDVFQPVYVTVTNEDSAGFPQIDTDRLNIQGNFMLVDGPTASISLKWLQRIRNDGQRIYVKPVEGKVLNLTPGGNIDIGTTVSVLDNQIVELIFTEDSSVTLEGGMIIVGIGAGGGGGINFPILYPLQDLGDQSGVNVLLNLNQTNGHAKRIRMTGNIGIQLGNLPPTGIAFVFYLMLVQDGVGGRSLSTVSSLIKNNSEMDGLLDKAPNAKTVFKMVTLDGGVSFHAERIDLTTSTGGGGLNTDLSNLASPTVPNKNIEMNNKAITGIDYLAGNESIQQVINSVATGWDYSVPNGQFHKFQTGLTTRFQVGQNFIDFLNVTSVRYSTDIDMLINSIFNVDNMVVVDSLGNARASLFGGTGSEFFIDLPNDNIFRITEALNNRVTYNGISNIFLLENGVAFQMRPVGGSNPFTITHLSTLVELDHTLQLSLTIGASDKFTITNTLMRGFVNLNMQGNDIQNVENLTIVDSLNNGRLSIFGGTGSEAFLDVPNNGIFRITEALANRVTFNGISNLFQLENGIALQLLPVGGSNPFTLQHFTTFVDFDHNTRMNFTIGASNRFSIQNTLLTAGTTLSMGGNPITNTGNITPDTTLTKTVGSASLIYSNIYSSGFRLDANSFITMSTTNVTIAADESGSGNVIIKARGTPKLQIDSTIKPQTTLDMGNNSIINTFDVQPQNDVSALLGQSGNSWLSTRTAILVLNGSSGSIGTTSAQISASSLGMTFNVPTGDYFEYYVNGSVRFRIDLDGSLFWPLSGVEHKFLPGSASLTLTLGGTNDIFAIGFAGTLRRYEIQDNQFIMDSPDNPGIMRIFLNETSPGTGIKNIGSFIFSNRDSANNQRDSTMQYIVIDNTSTNRQDTWSFLMTGGSGGGEVMRFETRPGGNEWGLHGQHQARPDYTLNTFVTDRNLSSAPTTTELRDVLATLITDLIGYGLLL